MIRTSYLCFLAILFITISCGEKAKITGEVVDGFGSPLPEVTIIVKGTTFKATTDSSGRYSVEYVPGKIQIIISKDGYSPVNLDIDIATPAIFPAEKVVLYEFPIGEGIWFFGKSDYLPLNRGKIDYTRKESSLSRGFDKPSFEENYKAIGEFTNIEEKTKLRFFIKSKRDYDIFFILNDSIIVTILTYLYHRKNKNEVFALKLNKELITRKDIYKDTSIWEIRGILKGKWAFVIKDQFKNGHKYEPIYLFEVKSENNK